MSAEVKQTKRIEYIDALRGFTMILVVLHHVSLMGFGIESVLGQWIVEFRMPLFFFISGFVLYKSSQVWNMKNIWAFLKKKITVQILSPLIFFLIFIYAHHKNLMESLVDPTKAGYWFTFMLFSYFLIYIAGQVVIDKLKISSNVRDFILICVGMVVFFLAYGLSYLLLEKSCAWAGLIGGANLKYFLFFGLGTLVKKHFNTFEKWLDATPLVLVSISVYFLMNVFYEPINNAGAIFRFLFIILTACTGIIGVFAFFRKYQVYFTTTVH